MRSPSAPFSHSTRHRPSPSPASTAQPSRNPSVQGWTDPRLLQNARDTQSIYHFTVPVTFEDLNIGVSPAPAPDVHIIYDGPDKAEIALDQEERAQLDYIELMQMKDRAHARDVDKHWKHVANPLQLDTRLRGMFKPAPARQPIDLENRSPAPLVYRDKRQPHHRLTRMDDLYGLADTPARARPSRTPRPGAELVRSPRVARIQSPTPRSTLALPEDAVRHMHSQLLIKMSDAWMDDVQQLLSSAGPDPKFTGLQSHLKAVRDLRDMTNAYLVHGSPPTITAFSIKSMLAPLDQLITGLKACGQNPRAVVAARELATRCLRAV